jgi:hypothetical protein
MSYPRIGLILAGLSFGIWEAISTFQIEVPEVAAVLSVLFLGFTYWFWRRNTIRAALALLPLFAIEVAAAPGLRHVMTVTKVSMAALGTAGIAMAVGVVVPRLLAKRSRAVAV